MTKVRTDIFSHLARRVSAWALVAVCAAVVAACSLSDSDGELLGDTAVGNGLTGAYEGVWSVDGHPLSSSHLEVYGSSLRFSALPGKAMVSLLMPEAEVGETDEVACVIPYELAGISSQANYYAMQNASWTFGLVVDGKSCVARLEFSPALDGGQMSWMTYSRMSGMYTLFLKLRHWSVTSLSGKEIDRSGDGEMNLKFVTTTVSAK